MPNLLTWNMQGARYSDELKWRTGVLNMFGASVPWRPDVICIQESGTRPPSAVPVGVVAIPSPPGKNPNVEIYGWAGSSTRPACTVVFYEWDVAGHRVNLAIVTRGVIPAPTVGLIWRAVGRSWRPALGLQVPGAGWVFSLHAISPGGRDAPDILTGCAAVGGAWWALGDYNRAPGAWIPAGTVTCPPDGPTHPVGAPVSTLDYIVRNGAVSTTGTRVDLVMSDHYPVAYIF